MRRLLCSLLLVVAGCHKSEPPAAAPHVTPAAPPNADALWALAPAGTKLGIVMTPRGLRMTEHAWQDIHAFIKAAPELADISAQLEHELASLGGDVSLAEYGMTADKGAAMFYVDETQAFMVIPVVDRDRFLHKTHGKRVGDVDQLAPDFICKPIKNVYACGDSADLLASLGTATPPPHLEARGDIEMLAEGYPGLFARRVTAVLQLERGEVVARGTIEGVPDNIVKMLGPASAPSVSREHTAGFVSATLAGVKNLVPAIPITGGLTAATFAQSLVGPIMLTVPAGELAVDVRIPLADPAPAATLVANCATLLPATVKNGTCTIPVPQRHTEISAWVEGTTLRIGMKNRPAPPSVPLTPVGAELASGTWNVSMWGRGSILGADIANVFSASGEHMDNPFAMRVTSMLSELGVGGRLAGDKLTYLAIVRTLWSNPDDVVAKITALPTSAMLSREGAVRARRAAGTTSPLAADLQADGFGLVVPVLVLSGIVVPAVDAHLTPRRRIETDAQLRTAR